jgi:magnesium-transporting ATPase (P-type)
MNTYNNNYNKEDHQYWLKVMMRAFLLLLILMMFTALAHATDSTGVSQLDTQATVFQKGVQMFAKWGGILAIVVGGFMLGSGKAQGQTAQVLFGLVAAIGIIMGAWGWFSNNFSYGFAF